MGMFKLNDGQEMDVTGFSRDEVAAALKNSGRDPNDPIHKSQLDSLPAANPVADQLNALSESLKQKMVTAPSGSVGQKRILDIIKGLEDVGPNKPKTKDENKALLKEGIIGATIPLLERLKNIETTSDPMSILNYLGQEGGNLLNLNPEVGGYKGGQEGLKIAILKNLIGEGGNTTLQEQLSALQLAFPQGNKIYSKDNRAEALRNVQNSIKGIGGVDIIEELMKLDPKLPEKIGFYEDQRNPDPSTVKGPYEGPKDILNRGWNRLKKIF